MDLWTLILKIGPYLLAAAGSVFGVVMRSWLKKAEEESGDLIAEVSDVLREALDVIPAIDAAVAEPSEETFQNARKQIEELAKELKDVVAFFGRGR